MKFLKLRCCATTVAVLVSILLNGITEGATLNVPADHATIQACIDAAIDGVDECVVSPGTYHEAINFLGKAIILRSSGGAEVTTIDANGGSDTVVTCENGEGPGTVLDGFTITGSVGFVGAMHNTNSSPTVSNCTFRGNSAFAAGGMYNDSGSSPTVTNCTFIGNSAHSAGGMYNGSSSSPTITNCTFSGNSASAAGAIYNGSSSSPIVINCMFKGNMATNAAGAIYNGSNSRPSVTNCTFSGNLASTAGAMYNGSSSSPKLTNCMFIGNTATNVAGALYNGSSSNITMINCTFIGNTGDFVGGMFNSTESNPTITNCTITRNSGVFAGGMYNSESSPTVSSSIFWNDSPVEFMTFVPATLTFSFSNVYGGLPVGVVDGGGNIDLDPMFVRAPDPGPDGGWDGVDDDYGDLRLQAGSPCINAGDPVIVAQPGMSDLEGHARILCDRVDIGAYEFGIGDYNCDRTINLLDFTVWQECETGPHDSEAFQLTAGCLAFDFDGNGDVELFDFAALQRILSVK